MTLISWPGANRPVTALVVRGASHPYYAFPLGGGWGDVDLLDDLPTSIDTLLAELS